MSTENTNIKFDKIEKLDFKDKTFVLSGDFISGTKADIEDEITQRGGKCSKAVIVKTNYLVVGSEGSTVWLNGRSGGKKVEKVVELKGKGKDIKIISEETLNSFLEQPDEEVKNNLEANRVKGEGVEATQKQSKEEGNIQSMENIETQCDTSHFIYEEVEDGIEIVKYNGSSRRARIPEVIDEKTVVSIGKKVFIKHNFATVKEVYVPKTIKRISPTAFYTAEFDPDLFDDKIENIIIDEDNPHLIIEEEFIYSKDKKVLYYCGNKEIKEYTMPNQVEHIGDYAFYCCMNLAKVSFSNSLKEIGKKAFAYCDSLTKVSLPYSLEKIDDYAFRKATSKGLKQFKLLVPDNVMFLGLGMPKNICIGDENKYFCIENNCLMNKEKTKIIDCIKVTSETFQIPDEITEVCEGAFAGCTMLKELKFNDKIKIIGDKAFNRTGIKKIKLPKSLEKIGKEVFTYTESYYDKASEIKVERGNKHFVTDGRTLIQINEDGTEILKSCFKLGILSYDIPEGVTHIEDNVFYNCEKLKSINIPHGVISIGDYFVKSFGGVKSLKLPSTVKNLGKLELTYMNNLELKIDSNNPVYECKDNVLYKNIGEEKILIKCFDKYIQSIQVPDGVTTIRELAFDECKRLNTVILPESITKLEDKVFYGCGLTTFDIPSHVTHVMDYVFSECSKLTKVNIPSRTIYISPKAFNECSKFTEYVVDENNPNYCHVKGVLYNKDKTEIVDFPSGKSSATYNVPLGVKSIGTAFCGCKRIKKLVLPKTIKEIEKKGFYDCKSLTSIELSDSIVSIGDEAFIGCESLCNITIPSSVESIGSNLFNRYYRETLFVHGEKGSAIESHLKNSDEGNAVVYICDNESPEVIEIKKKFKYCINDNFVTIEEYLGKDKNLVIPEKIEGKTVTHLGDHAFKSKDLEEVKMPDSIVSIGKEAFKYNSELTKIILSSNLREIPYGMLSCCYELKELVIPPSVTSIGKNSLEHIKLNKVIIPSSVKKIDENIFGEYRYDVLETVFIGEKGSEAERFILSKGLNFVTDDLSEDDIKAKHNFTYEIKDDGVYITSINSNEVTIDIPETIEQKNIVSVYCYFSSYGENLKNLSISSTVKEIDLRGYIPNLESFNVSEENANYSTDGVSLYNKDKTVLIQVMVRDIKKYSIPNSVKTIKNNSFKDCTEITELIIPEGVILIDDSAFYNMKKLGKVTLPHTLKHVGKYAFYGTQLSTLSGGDNIEEVGVNAFSDTPWYTSSSLIILGNSILYKYNGSEKIVRIPEGIKEIADNAFAGERYSWRKVDDLESVVIPDTVTHIGKGAFANRKELRKVILSNNITKIEEDTFEGCKKLSNIEIPSSVIQINKGAFGGCSSIKSIDIPQKVERLEEGVFSGCTSVSKITIPASVNFIEIGALPNKLEEITVQSENKHYCDIDGVLFDKDMKTLILFPNNSSLKEYVVPHSVEKIELNAFSRNKNLEYIKISNNVSNIGDGAFSYCKKLRTIELPENIDNLGIDNVYNKVGIFKGCKSLENIIWPKNIKEIGSYTFKECGLTTLEIPETVSTIGKYAFANINATSVTIPKTVKTVDLGCFAGVKEITIYDTIDPNGKDCKDYCDDRNGKPNSNVGLIGSHPKPDYEICAASPNTSWYDHMIVVRSTETNDVLYKVWMGGIEEPREFYCTLSSSWGRSGGFNFEKVDNLFKKIKKFDNKIKVASLRLEYPIELSEDNKKMYLDYLKRSTKRIVEEFINSNDIEGLRKFETYGFITNKNIDALIDYANTKQSTEILAFLMNYKNNKLKKKEKSFRL